MVDYYKNTKSDTLRSEMQDAIKKPYNRSQMLQYVNINCSDVQRKNAKNVDRSNFRAPWRNGS